MKQENSPNVVFSYDHTERRSSSQLPTLPKKLQVTLSGTHSVIHSLTLSDSFNTTHTHTHTHAHTHTHRHTQTHTHTQRHTHTHTHRPAVDYPVLCCVVSLCKYTAVGSPLCSTLAVDCSRHELTTVFLSNSSGPVWAPRCKNRPAPFPGRMS